MLRRVASGQRNGFTTIEAMIAAVVFLVGLAGLLGALVQARNATGQARRLMQATDVANDLAEQIQLWDLTDPRLVDSAGACAADPLDTAEVLNKPGPAFDSYVACMHNETTLKQPNTRFGGLPQPVFVDELGNSTRYNRYFIVRSQVDQKSRARRIHVWVKVLYMDAGTPRSVTVHTIRVLQTGVML
jgi:type II secretory pathway pseudopilin PulG